MNLSKLIRNERAQGLVEFALTLLLFLMLIFMIIELGRIMHAIVTLQAGVRAGARYAVTGDLMPEYGANPSYGWVAGSSEPLEQIAPCWPLFYNDPVVPDGSPRKPANDPTEHQPFRNARTCSIEHQALGQMTSLQLNPQAGNNDPNSYRITVRGSGVLPDVTETYTVDPLGTFGSPDERNYSDIYGTDPLPTGLTLLNGYGGLPQQKVVVQATYRLPIITPILSSIAPSLQLSAQAVMTNEAFGSTGLNREAILPPELGEIPPLEFFDPPDLVITGFDTDPVDWESLNQGDDLNSVDIHIENQGGQTASLPGSDIEVCFYVTTDDPPPDVPGEIIGTAAGCGYFTSLDKDATTTITIAGPITIPVADVVFLYGWVDSGEIIDEGEAEFEDNNLTHLGPLAFIDTANLEIEGAVDSLTPSDGGPFTYTLTVSNGGSSDPNDVEVVVNLPSGEGFGFLSSTDAVCNLTATDEITCTVGTVAQGTPVTFVLNLTAGPNTGAYTLTASADSASTFDPDGASTSDEVAVNGTNLSLTKIIDDDEPVIGEEIHYTVVVDNEGPNVASGVQVVDDFASVAGEYTGISTEISICSDPGGVTCVPDASGSYDYTTSPIWTIGPDIGVGESAKLVITATVNTVNPISNTAEVDYLLDADDSDDLATANGATSYFDLALSFINEPTDGYAGGLVTYELSLDNPSPVEAELTKVTVTLPAQLTVESFDIDEGSFIQDSVNPNLWLWSTASLPATTGSNSLTIHARIDSVLSEPPPALTVDAEITTFTPPDDNDATNNAVTTTFTPSGNLDLELVSGTVTPLTAIAGDTLTYTYEIINNGPGTAFGVTLADALPAYIISELRIDELDVQNSSITVILESDGTLSLGDLPAGENPTLVISGTVRGRTTTETFTNTATLDLDSPGDSTSDNNEVDLEVTLTPLTYAYNIADQNGSHNCDDDKVWGADSSLGVDYTWVEIPSSILNGSYSSSGYGTYTIRDEYGDVLDTAGTDLFTCRVWDDFHLDFDDLKEGTWTVILGFVDDYYTDRTIDVTFTTAYMGPLPPVLDDYNITTAAGSMNKVELVTIDDVQVGSDNSLRIDFYGVNHNAIGNAILLQYKEAPAQEADLFVTKTLVDPATGSPISGAVYPGDDIRFSITVENDGPNKASGVSIYDELDDGLIFNSASAGKGAYSYSTGVWSIGTIEDGDSYTLTIDATIDPGLSVPVDLYNTASVATTLQANPIDGNSSTILIDVNQPNANIQVTQGGTTSAFPGDTVTFTVTATNAGPKDATLVEITDLLGDGLTFVSATPSDGSVSVTQNPGADDVIVWSIPALAMGTFETLTIEATVDSPLSFPTDIDNIATRTASTPSDLIPGDNSDTVTVTVNDPRIDLRLEKSVSPDAPASGGSFTYTLTLTNDAAAAVATGVEVTDTLPAGITVTGSDTHGYGSYAAGVWSGFDLNPGFSATLDITGTVTASQGTVITNTAEVTDVNETDRDSTPNNGNTGEDDYASVAFTTASPNNDLALALSADDTTPTVYDDVVFTIDVDEQGIGAATGVEVTLTLPDGLTYESDTGTCTDSAVAGGTLVTCDMGAIAQSGSASVTVTASVDEDEEGSNFNVTAAVTADQTDGVPGNNADSLNVTPHANFYFLNIGPTSCGDRAFGASAVSGHWAYPGQAATWEILGRRNLTLYQIYTAPSGLDWLGSVDYIDGYVQLSDEDRTVRYPDTSAVTGGIDADMLFRCREERSSLTVRFNNLEPGTYRLYYLSWNYNNSTNWNVFYQVGSGSWQTWLSNYDSYASAGDNVMDVEVSSSIVLGSTNSLSIIIGNGGMTSGIGIERLP